jgi:RND family efflux transporter MFP subunit
MPVALCLAALLAACSDPRVATAPEPKAVYVTTVKRTAQSDTRVLTATVRARVETELAFRAPGKVTRRLVDVGDSVKAGQPLAHLDAADYQLGVNAAQAQVLAAKADAEQAAADEARLRRLAADGSVGAADHERQKARADAAAARLDQAQRQWALARNRSDYTVLVAPYAGVVTALRIEAGQVVAEGQTVASLARQDDREFVVDLPEGMTADVRSLNATARPWQGAVQPIALKLRELSPVAGAQGRTFRARFAATGAGRGPANQLALGSTALVSLQGASTPGLRLPASAIVKTNEAAGVWVVDAIAGSLKFQPVQVTASEADHVRVTGLSDGLLVVSVGGQKLEASMKVRPLERSDDEVTMPVPMPMAVARSGS